MIKQYFRSRFLLSSIAAASILSACQTTVQSPNIEDRSAAYVASSITTDSFAQSMITAAYEAEEKDMLQEAAIFMAKAYDKQPDNEAIAWRYARLLRLNNRNDQATTLLTPYSVRENVSNDVLREYVSAHLANGELEQAYISAQQLDTRVDNDARAYNVLGVVADANGFHEEAIVYFNKGLETVKPSDKYHAILMNNKALALVQKGAGEEALQSMKQALSGAQDFPQIKNNFEAVKELSKAGMMQGAEVKMVMPANKAQISQPVLDEPELGKIERDLVERERLSDQGNQGDQTGDLPFAPAKQFMQPIIE